MEINSIAHVMGLQHLCSERVSVPTSTHSISPGRPIRAKIVHAPEKGPWAAGYYTVLCVRTPMAFASR